MTEEDYNYYLEQTKLGNEIWEDIKDYVGYYQVSNLGRVRSLDREVIDRNGIVKNINGRISNLGRKEGYQRIVFYIDGVKGRGFSVHRLVAQAFIPNPENKPMVNHKDGIKYNNKLDNLEWNTASENTQWSYIIGLQLKGEHHSQSKLTDVEVIEIARLLDLPKSNIAKIAREYKVDPKAIQCIRLGITWNHLTNRFGKIKTIKRIGSNHHGAKAVINCRGEVYETVTEAVRKYGTSTSRISKSCRKQRVTSGKYSDGSPISWKYYQESQE